MHFQNYDFLIKVLWKQLNLAYSNTAFLSCKQSEKHNLFQYYQLLSLKPTDDHFSLAICQLRIGVIGTDLNWALLQILDMGRREI